MPKQPPRPADVIPAPEYIVAYMPDGKPAPFVLTQDELIRFLRLDQTGASYPHESLRLLRHKYPHILKGVKLGKCVRFRLEDAMAVLPEIQRCHPR